MFSESWAEDKGRSCWMGLLPGCSAPGVQCQLWCWNGDPRTHPCWGRGQWGVGKLVRSSGLQCVGEPTTFQTKSNFPAWHSPKVMPPCRGTLLYLRGPTCTSVSLPGLWNDLQDSWFLKTFISFIVLRIHKEHVYTVRCLPFTRPWWKTSFLETVA